VSSNLTLDTILSTKGNVMVYNIEIYREEKLIEERAKFVQDILARGKKAVFTRPHYCLDNCDVIKKVTEWKADINEEKGMYDIFASECVNASTPWICLFDRTYTITEE